MEDIKNVLSQFKEEIKLELANLKRLKGKNLKQFMDIFSLEGEFEIYFNSYNIVITDTLLHDQLRNFLKSDALVIEVNLHQSNTQLWVYQYFNERILNDYLK